MAEDSGPDVVVVTPMLVDEAAPAVPTRPTNTASVNTEDVLARPAASLHRFLVGRAKRLERSDDVGGDVTGLAPWGLESSELGDFANDDFLKLSDFEAPGGITDPSLAGSSTMTTLGGGRSRLASLEIGPM